MECHRILRRVRRRSRRGIPWRSRRRGRPRWNGWRCRHRRNGGLKGFHLGRKAREPFIGSPLTFRNASLLFCHLVVRRRRGGVAFLEPVLDSFFESLSRGNGRAANRLETPLLVCQLRVQIVHARVRLLHSRLKFKHTLRNAIDGGRELECSFTLLLGVLPPLSLRLSQM